MILHLYFARKTLTALITVTGIFAALILMIEMIEQIRIFSPADLSLGTLFYLSLLRIPFTLYTIFPILMIISTLVLFLGLARSSELVITRASGRSAMRSLQAPLLVAFIVGLLVVAVLNPLVAATSREFDQLKAEYLDEQTQIFSVSDEGLWLRQGDEAGQVVIRASRSNFDGSTLFGVTFLGFATNGAPEFRLEADSARLEDGVWIINNAKRWPLNAGGNPEALSQTLDIFELPTTLTLDEIHDTFGTPSAVPIWEIPSFINRLDKAGFSARAYKMWFHSELALPLTLVAMMLIGAGFTMRHTRFGNTASRVVTALLLAFAFFFLRNFASILGENGEIPIVLAAWAPPAAVILAALALLLHLEDG
ncbi:MAG: lipopolysaccharide export system permease protein [Celeribacter sp.]|mgnify:CR=1 FL=1|jgi:lipopolysaccharide export system permease protein